MKATQDPYYCGEVPLGRIRNRNELRVAHMLTEMLDEEAGFAADPIDVQDIYALALNRLPPHYVQEKAIILREVVDDESVRQAIREAMQIVRDRPNHS